MDSLNMRSGSPREGKNPVHYVSDSAVSECGFLSTRIDAIVIHDRIWELKKITNSYFKRFECFSKNIYVAFCIFALLFCCH